MCCVVMRRLLLLLLLLLLLPLVQHVGSRFSLFFFPNRFYLCLSAESPRVQANVQALRLPSIRIQRREGKYGEGVEALYRMRMARRRDMDVMDQ